MHSRVQQLAAHFAQQGVELEAAPAEDGAEGAEGEGVEGGEQVGAVAGAEVLEEAVPGPLADGQAEAGGAQPVGQAPAQPPGVRSLCLCVWLFSL